MEKERASDVYRQADDGNDEEAQPVHGLRIEQSLDALIDDPRDDRGDGHTVGKCSEDFRALEAVGMPRRGGAHHEPVRADGDEEAENIGRQMSCIREQCERAKQDGARELQEQERGIGSQREPEGLRLRAARYRSVP
jgi:hypothetical protein